MGRSGSEETGAYNLCFICSTCKDSHLFNKLSGNMLDILWDDQVFYVERVHGEFVVVEGCTSTYYTRLSPVELIALGTELIVAGTGALREDIKA
jgi:hypothetical protein